MRFLIECTYVFEHPEVNSGIQRVVRNIIRELGSQQSGIECVPVIIIAGKLYRVISLAPLSLENLTPLQWWILRLDRLRTAYWAQHARLERLLPVRSSLTARRLLYWPCKVASLVISLPLRGLLWLNRHSGPLPERAVPITPKSDDQLILLDSSWHADIFPVAERLKREGVGIIAVIYDLIPLTHPQYCDIGLVRVFDHWFDWIARTADGFMAISKTISDQVKLETQRRLGKDEAAQRWHGHFHLGSELDLCRPAARLQPDMERMFRDSAPVYLMVSTIEPRKNHTYLLDAFELLWAQDSSARLCIIGRVGWKCEALVDRIKKHPQWGRRLFMFNRVNDKSLEYAYANARALIFPSHVEGFGLPLVEAMQRGLPVMASDIPVFREIGGEFMAYFELDDPKSLTDLVQEFDSTNRFPALRDVSMWQWINWREASQQLVSGTLTGVLHQRSAERTPT